MSDDPYRTVERHEDMSATGTLRLIQQDDGDICLLVTEEREQGGDSAGIEFCTSGGRSPATLKALLALARAMAIDNRRDPEWAGKWKGEFFIAAAMEDTNA